MRRFLKQNTDALPFLVPAFVLLFDVFATMVVLSHEPGITAKDALVYYLMLEPAEILRLSGMPIKIKDIHSSWAPACDLMHFWKKFN